MIERSTGASPRSFLGLHIPSTLLSACEGLSPEAPRRCVREADWILARLNPTTSARCLYRGWQSIECLKVRSQNRDFFRENRSRAHKLYFSVLETSGSKWSRQQSIICIK